jgi:hypothetical protein
LEAGGPLPCPGADACLTLTAKLPLVHVGGRPERVVRCIHNVRAAQIWQRGPPAARKYLQCAESAALNVHRLIARYRGEAVVEPIIIAPMVQGYIV